MLKSKAFITLLIGVNKKVIACYMHAYNASKLMTQTWSATLLPQ